VQIYTWFKISEGGKWESHQMPCAHSSRKVNNYRICPIRIEIIHGRHRVVEIYTELIRSSFRALTRWRSEVVKHNIEHLTVANIRQLLLDMK
jgi:hypothetical protein